MSTVSIITVAKNSASTLPETLESVLAQTFPDIEHIVVDGASADGTVELLRRYAPRYGGRLHWLSEPDSGMYDALNKGLLQASGKVVGCLNADDRLASPGVIAAVAEALADPAVDAVHGGVRYVAPSGRTVRTYGSAHFRRWHMRLGLMPAHPSFYCRTDLYRRHGNYRTDMRVAADFEMLLRLVYCHRIRLRRLPLNFVDMAPGGMSNAGLRSHLAIAKDHRLAFRANGLRHFAPLEWLRYPLRLLEYL